MELGSVAEWLSALGALGALVAASIAAWAALRANRQQRDELTSLIEERADRKRHEERATAARVAVWARTDRHGTPALRYINSSGLPIFGVTIWVSLPEDWFPFRYPAIGPSPESRVLRQGTEELRLRSKGTDLVSLLEDGQVLCALTFRDTRDRWWYRDVEGGLTKFCSRADAEAAAKLQGNPRPAPSVTPPSSSA